MCTLTQTELAALGARVNRLNALADRALEDNNDRKAERLTDKADALAMALAAYEDGSADERDLGIIAEALLNERLNGHLNA
jgi:hypothetical protein